MDSLVITTNRTDGTADIAIVGGGPAALVLAIALARRGIRTTVFERDAHPEVAPRFNPDRSYTIVIGEVGGSPTELLEAAKLYNTKWKPEADAVSWMSVKSLFENRLHMLRANITMKLGLCIFSQAKSVDIPYSEVRRKAERLWPLWA